MPIRVYRPKLASTEAGRHRLMVGSGVPPAGPLDSSHFIGEIVLVSCGQYASVGASLVEPKVFSLHNDYSGKGRDETAPTTTTRHIQTS